MSRTELVVVPQSKQGHCLAVHALEPAHRPFRAEAHPGLKMFLLPNSTQYLLESFPMFGHPGISALEYAGIYQMDRMVKKEVVEVSLKRKSTTASTQVESGAKEEESGEALHFIDEFGCQQRRRGTFINHTPRNFEMRASRTVDVYRPSTRAESENYSRPLSRQSSMASGSPAISNPHCRSPSGSSGTFGKLSSITDAVPELDSTEISPSSPAVYLPSTNTHRRSMSAPLSKMLTYQPGATEPSEHPSRDPSHRSTSLSGHQAIEPKRQRRQTPFKIAGSQQISLPRHAPLDPWVAAVHRRVESKEFLGDVPYDMDREVSAEFGTFGVIQRHFDSQGGGPVLASRSASVTPPPNIPLPISPESSVRRRAMEPIAIYPIDELSPPDSPPPVPDRSPKRLTNPSFPLPLKSHPSTDSFKIAAEGAYNPYDRDSDLHVPKKRAMVLQPRAASANGFRMAPTILGHDAQLASSDLRLNELNYFLKHTGPSPEPPAPTQQPQKKKGMRLFRVKPGKTLAARVGSVESSTQRARIPSCARQMTTSGGARHLRIVIPTESPRASRSRHVTITEEMLNPLASPEVERVLATVDEPVTPVPKSPRSLKRSPQAVPVTDHPLALSSRDEQTRARKLRDLQRIKRKPVPDRTVSGDTMGGALLTPAHTPEPDEDVEQESVVAKMGRLKDHVVALQRQNELLAEALAGVVGLELAGGEREEGLRSEDVLEAYWRMRG